MKVRENARSKKEARMNELIELFGGGVITNGTA
jgi:hypothetical protein